jgi:hypothetical protein
MGNQQSISTAISDTVNKSMTNVLMSSSSSCTQNNTISQTLTFNNIDLKDTGCTPDFNNINQDSKQSPNFTCSSDNSNNTELLSQFKTQLDQEAKATAENFPIGNQQSMTTTINNIVNDVTANIDIAQLSTCVQTNSTTQSQIYENIKSGCPKFCNDGCPKGNSCDKSLCKVNFSNINQYATQSAVGSCLSSNSNVQKIITDASNTIKQSASSTTKGVDIAGIVNSIGDAISSVISSTWLPFIIIGLVIVCFCSSAAALFLSTNGGSVSTKSS